MASDPAGGPDTLANMPLRDRLKHLLKVLAAIGAFLLAMPPIVLLASWRPYSALAIAIVAALWALWSWHRQKRLPLTGKWAIAVCLFAVLGFWSGYSGIWATEDRKMAMAQKAKEAAADREAREKREAAELAELRKSDPDAYLARLKDKDTTLWTEEAKVLRPKIYAAHLEDMRRANEAAEMERQRKKPLDYLTLTYKWHADGFGVVMIANFTIKSVLKFPVKDFVIGCTAYGSSGTKIGELATTVYQVVSAKSTKQINNVNMGFMSAQTSTASCRILRADPA